MTTTRVNIGISACFLHADPQRQVFNGRTLLYLEQSLGHWVMSQGAAAYLIPSPPPRAPIAADDLIAPLDGLVLAGGVDVAPSNYGETSLHPDWSGDPVRDAYDMALLRACMAQGKPVLGVCRGAQLLNVALGGSLYQDIPTQIPTAKRHRCRESYERNCHTIALEENGGLARLYPGVRTATINSVHHQAIKSLGKGLVVEAQCIEDGVVEAVRLQGGTYAVGVQWHPEFHDPSDASLLDGAPILKEFLTAAATRKMHA